MKKKLMIYGSTGYTGKLISKAAQERGVTPVLAGRSEDKLRSIAGELGLRYRTFDLSDSKLIDTSLRDIDVIINAAGPFSSTSIPLVESCLRTHTHYLDLAGEIDDFEKLTRYDSEAKKKKITILPGTGFDVVPSDCLSLYVSKKIPGPHTLYMCMTGLKTISRGTLKTGIEGFKKGIRIRKNGEITKIGKIKFRTADFGEGKKTCISMTWGDVSTAYYTTGIRNIEEYMELSPGNCLLAFTYHYLGWFYGSPFMQKVLAKYADKQSEGPTEEKRNREKSVFVATVEGRNGTSASARLITPEGYKLTYMTCLLIAEKVLKGKFKAGFTTPAKAYGSELIMEIEGVGRVDIHDATFR